MKWYPPKQCPFCLTRNAVSILRRVSKVNIETNELEVPYHLFNDPSHLYVSEKNEMPLQGGNKALLQLTQQLSELMDAIQCIVLGKLPINLINPTALYNILTHCRRAT